MKDIDFISFLLKQDFTFLLCKPKSEFTKILDRVDNFNKQGIKKFQFALLLKLSLSDSYPELVFAYVNACLSFKSKTNKAGSIPLEMLIYLSGARSITEAISKIGADGNGEFLIFSNSKDILGLLEKEGLFDCVREIKKRDITATDLPIISEITKNKLEAK